MRRTAGRSGADTPKDRLDTGKPGIRTRKPVPPERPCRELGLTMANHDIESTRNRARALLDSRIESVTDLVTARQRVADLQKQLTEAERDAKRAYVRATKDGWSAEELKKLGLEPAMAGRGRTATPRETPAGTATPPHGDPLDAAGKQE